MRCLVGWIFKFPVYKHLKCKYLASGMMNAIHRDMAFSTANIKNTTSNVNGFVLRWKHSSIIFTIAAKRNSLVRRNVRDLQRWNTRCCASFLLANIDSLWILQLNYFAEMGFLGEVWKFCLWLVLFLKPNIHSLKACVSDNVPHSHGPFISYVTSCWKSKNLYRFLLNSLQSRQSLSFPPDIIFNSSQINNKRN